MAASGLGLGWLWGLGLKGAGDPQRWRRERPLKSNRRDNTKDLLSVIAVAGTIFHLLGLLTQEVTDLGLNIFIISKLLLPRLISPVCGSRSWLLARWTVIQTKPRLVIRLTTVMFCVISKKKCLPRRTLTTFSVNFRWDLCHRRSRRIIPEACQQFRIG